MSRYPSKLILAHSWQRCTILVLLAGALVGCTTKAEFSENAVYILKQELASNAEFSQQRHLDLADVMAGMFGTPDEPNVPKLGDVEISKILDATHLYVASGPVSSDERGRARGLYREHCAHCHGVTGDGAGPTAAFLNPYPRDYRMGIFKFKSTPKGGKPTHEDLKDILVNGIPGTAMPSFKVLPNNELEALISYVRYLSIRGEVERSLVFLATNELGADERLFDISAPAEVKSEQASLIREYAAEVAQKWVDAESQATPIESPDPDRDMVASIKHGRELFYGPIANCVKCHGDSALGDGQKSDYDDWTKELEPTNEEVLEEFLGLGSFVLAPRNIHPRNLRQGVYRGGRRPIDLFRRVHNGIDGTPMPGALIIPDDAPAGTKGLTKSDLWSLVDYVRSLPYESISRPPVIEQGYQRSRM
ncbi:MAG: c-type cytochrome [Planctomycetaceae bacterium]|nr:c-type cytochrome [Planctomycetales bacterium]MCB9874747.1 c-type cytochrome [Planctomycetaceae bacterium]MCB9941701.1 c-type cytochrome [Planctomycetaceae bacterium]